MTSVWACNTIAGMDALAAKNQAATAQIVLASASPRRHELLLVAGIPHRVLPSSIDEQPEPGETPEGYTRRAAQEKARQVTGRCPAGTWVLSADTSVVVDDQVLGKPRDLSDGRRMLELLSGRSHRVLTAVCLAQAQGRPCDDLLEQTLVTFRSLPPDWVAGYLATGEPMDKAGGYGIQGIGAMLVRSISGSYTNVVGLPLGETVDLLERAGAFRPFEGGSR